MRDASLLNPIELGIRVDSEILRLDQAVLNELRKRQISISRNRLKELFENRGVLLNGLARPASWTLLPGDHQITLLGIGSDSRAQPSKRGSFLPIAFEDSDLLILDKSSGIPSVPHDPSETETAVGSALAHLPSLQGIGRSFLEPGLLHRLDTGTSGLLAFAKTNEAFEKYKLLWKTGQVKKIYRAWTQADAGALHLPHAVKLTLAHHPESKKRMIALNGETRRRFRGKPLETRTWIRKLHERRNIGGAIWSDLEIEIETGVMHQIRCTLAHLGLPIGGDSIYGRQSDSSKRLLLHAWKLILPREIEIVAELPKNFSPA